MINNMLIMKNLSKTFNPDTVNEKCALNSVELELKKGDSLGIIGSTGSGKSTVIKLLMRFYDTDKGNIYINGENIKARKKTNNKWFETQDSISYWDDFSKPKLFYADITQQLNFCL